MLRIGFGKESRGALAGKLVIDVIVPIARKARPNVVRCTSSQIPMATAAKIHACAGTPRKKELPSARNDAGKSV